MIVPTRFSWISAILVGFWAALNQLVGTSALVVRPTPLPRIGPQSINVRQQDACYGCLESKRRPWEDDDNDPLLPNEPEEESSLLISAANRVISILTQPTGIFASSGSPMVLGYPLALLVALVATATSSPFQALFTVVLFFAVAWLGRQIIVGNDDYYEEEDDDRYVWPDEPKRRRADSSNEEEQSSLSLNSGGEGLDFLALVVSVAASALLVPSSTSSDGGGGGGLDLGVLIGLPVVLIALLQVLRDVSGIQKDEEEAAARSDSSSWPQRTLMDLWDRRLEREMKKKKNKQKRLDD